ncbi:MAG: GNAT family N-acetyltransferase [Bacillota bacterium]
MSPIEYRLFAPRNREEMIDLQSRAYVMPRSQADCFYEEGEVESLGAFEGSHLASALDIIHFRIRLWDREVEAGGIASVATSGALLRVASRRTWTAEAPDLPMRAFVGTSPYRTPSTPSAQAGSRLRYA